VVKKYFGKAEAARLLPVIKKTDHKYTRGRALLFAGGADFPGAGVLASQAAMRMGCGYVTLAQKNIHPLCESPDLIFLDLNKKNWREQEFEALLLGPGFGVNEFTKNLIGEFKALNIPNVILDADALTVCSRYNLFPLPPSWILTPHAGELSRCLSVDVKVVESQREDTLIEAQKKMGCVVLLKGFGTLITDGKNLYQIRSGNQALAKAGSGDVLSGIITALSASGLEPLEAAVLGSYVHGATANLWQAQKKDLLSMRAVDILDLLPRVLNILRGISVN
jgi:ADP-dependent NAD(P)H-hydrate dehydratase